MRGPSGRRHHSRTHRHIRKNHHVSATPQLVTGVANDDTSWWTRLFAPTTKPTKDHAHFSNCAPKWSWEPGIFQQVGVRTQVHPCWSAKKPPNRHKARSPNRHMARSNPRTNKHINIRYHALRSHLADLPANASPRWGTRHCHFDTDSFKIGVDNHASRCMSNNRAHFENFRPSRSNATVGGIAGGLEIKGEGTFVFKLEDDDGKLHTIRIPNSLYLPRLPVSLLSPQHWAQEANDNVPIPRGTRMENFADGCKLSWSQLDFSKTVPFDPATNTPVFRTAASTCSYCAFVSSAIDVNHAFYRTEVVTPTSQIPRRITPPTPDEFIADENINMSENGGGNNNTPTKAPANTHTIS